MVQTNVRDHRVIGGYGLPDQGLLDLVNKTRGVDYLFVGGYANAGKTTLIERLGRVIQVEVISLSRICHLIIEAWIGEPADTKNPEVRRRFINFIEEGLMKNIGRETIVKSAMVNPSVNYLVVIETIGGEEFKMFLNALPSQATFTCVNVRSSLEQQGVDKRVLIPGANEYRWESEEDQANKPMLDISNWFNGYPYGK